jgi:amino acid transporter
MTTMKRSLGPVALMFTAVSGILGSAWLFGPYYAAQMAGPAALISWFIGAVAMMVIAMTFAELTSMFPIAGAQARFMLFSHGSITSFLFGWIMWLAYAAVAPAETMAILQYMGSSFPALLTTKHGTPILSTLGYGVAAVVLLAMCIINLISIKWLARYNAIVVWIKMFVPLMVAIMIIALAFNVHNFTSAGFMPGGWEGTLSALSLGGIVFALTGYAPAIVLAGEAKDPQKTIPLVLGGSLFICFLVYFILQIALIGAVPAGSLANGWAHLQFAGSQSPFVGIAEDSLHQHWLHYLILITAVATPLGTAIIFIASSARVAYAMSENGFFPKAMETLSKRGVPFWAVLLNFVVGMVLFFPVPGWQGMMGFLVAAFVLGYAIGPLALLSLRKQIPDFPRRFNLPWAKSWCFIAFFFTNLILYWVGWNIYSKMLIGVVLGLVVMLISRWRHHQVNALDLKHSLWAFIYIFGQGALSYLGNFGGGKGVLPHDWDMLLIGVFSAVILYLSHKQALPSTQTQVYIDSVKDR